MSETIIPAAPGAHCLIALPVKDEPPLIARRAIVAWRVNAHRATPILAGDADDVAGALMWHLEPDNLFRLDGTLSSVTLAEATRISANLLTSHEAQ